MDREDRGMDPALYRVIPLPSTSRYTPLLFSTVVCLAYWLEEPAKINMEDWAINYCITLYDTVNV